MKTSTFEIAGHTVVETVRNCVRKSLTEEIQDIAAESVEEFLNGPDRNNVFALAHSQDVLVDYFKYYTDDALQGQVDNVVILGDSRNNLDSDHGKKFVIEIAFTVKHSLIATRITYTITYKTS